MCVCCDNKGFLSDSCEMAVATFSLYFTYRICNKCYERLLKFSRKQWSVHCERCLKHNESSNLFIAALRIYPTFVYKDIVLCESCFRKIFGDDFYVNLICDCSKHNK